MILSGQACETWHTVSSQCTKLYPKWILAVSWLLVNDNDVNITHTYRRQPPTDIQYTALLTCCHCSRISGRYRRKYFRGKLSVSGQVAGLFQDTSSLRGLRFTGVAFTLSGGSGLTADRTKRSDQKGQFAHHGEKTTQCLWLEISQIRENNYVINVTLRYCTNYSERKMSPLSGT